MLVAEKKGEQWVVLCVVDHHGTEYAQRVADGFVSELAALGWIRHCTGRERPFDWCDDIGLFLIENDEDLNEDEEAS